MSLGWWYYAKKRFSIYPGITRAVAADFLSDYYESRRGRQSPGRVLVNAIVYGAFQLWVPFRARSIARKFGCDARWTGKAISVARARFADPNDLALFRIEQPSDLDAFIRRYEHAEISKRINPINWRADCVLADKISFHARCREHALPQPPLLATIIDGQPSILAEAQGRQLAVKPAGGEGGSGFRLLDLPAGAGGEPGAFAAFLKARLGRLRGRWLVQAKLDPHPALRDIAMAALPTARITTMRNEEGGLEFVTTVLRFPSDPASHVDNIKAGGLMAPIDPVSGRLGMACRGRGVGDFYDHPVTGARIAGLCLPLWEEAKALALDAHGRAFPEYTLVGWDIAITEDGPILIEGNGKPCNIVAQRAPRKGLGESRFGELIAYHLKHSPGA